MSCFTCPAWGRYKVRIHTAPKKEFYACPRHVDLIMSIAKYAHTTGPIKTTKWPLRSPPKFEGVVTK